MNLISKEVLAMPFTPHKMISLNIDTWMQKLLRRQLPVYWPPGRRPGYRRVEQMATNLAPFAYFSGVSARPPIFMLSIGQRDDHPKDTLRNILETREYVINFADQSLAKAVDTTARELPYGENEALWPGYVDRIGPGGCSASGRSGGFPGTASVKNSSFGGQPVYTGFGADDLSARAR
jgi:hypothetical protein